MKKTIIRFKKYSIFLLFCISVFAALPFINVSASGDIKGQVFRDYNGNGVFDTSGSAASPAVDVGVAGITVTAYDQSGTVCGSAVTTPTGNYKISTTGTGPYRIEFTNLPAGFFPSAASNDSVNSATATTAGSTVQFVKEGGSEFVNLAINHPDDYCQNNPDICINEYVAGNNENTAAPNSGLWRIPYTASGVSSPSNQTSIASKNQVGSTWGLAYSKMRRTLYSAAFLKRHVGLENSSLGGIYVSDIASTSSSQMPQATLLTTIANAGTIPINTGITNRGLGAPTAKSSDTDAFSKIGKAGLGDIDFSQDENTLFVVNLHDKKLYAVPVNPAGVAGAADSVNIPNPNCPGGDWRPFALGRRRGEIYVGGVCDASASQTKSNLRAIIYRVNVNPMFSSSTFTQVLNFSLGNFTKGSPFGTCNGGWFPWTAANLNTIPANPSCTNRTVYPQPILSDIEFDNDGSMIIGFIDRFGHQVGYQNFDPNGLQIPNEETIGGDILRAFNNAGTFVLESNGSVGGLNGGVSNGQGPNGGEFYQGDHLIPYHSENSEGGLAMLPGARDVVLSFMDPVSIYTSGVAWMSNTNGTRTRGYNVTGNFGKSNGVGDIEMLCDLAPIEIGNRVWRDLDADGIQDSSEPGIGGVTVRLFNPSNTTTAIATAVTDTNGEYFFRSGTAIDSNINDHIGTFNGQITPNTNYQIRLDNPSDYAVSAPLAGLFVTTSNAGTNDSIDSDAFNVTNPSGSSAGTFPVITLTTGVAGANNHTFDFGFSARKPVETCCDKLKVTPMSKLPFIQDFRIFEVFNFKQPASPICSIDIAMQPTITWQGGQAFQNMGGGSASIPVSFTPNFQRIPTLGTPSMAAVSVPINSPAVKFNLSISNAQPYTGKVVLTVNHCDDTKCILVYEPWINNPVIKDTPNTPVSISWSVENRELSAELVEVTLTFVGERRKIPLPEGGRGANFLNLNLLEEGLEIYAIDGAETTDKESKKLGLNSSSKTKNSASFEFSGLLDLNDREQTGRTIKFLVRKKPDQKIDSKQILLTVFDENANIIMTGNPR